MNLIKESWNAKDYQEYLQMLVSLKEESYASFHSRLTSTQYSILGIRVPIQRKIAKEILKGNFVSFLSLCGNTFYEEVNIEGFVIAAIKDEKTFDLYFDSFLLKIDNWAICDGFCSSMKVIPRNKEKYFLKIKELLQSSHDFTVRVGIVLLLHYYIEVSYLDKIFPLLLNLSSNNYYIEMAVAWFVAECYIKFPKFTYPYIENHSFQPSIHQKILSKIYDSYRVSKEDKQILKSLH